MKILITARLKARSGNNSTALRIKDHLLSDGHDVQIKCVSTFENSAEFNAYASCNKLDVIIGIHAFRAGQLIYGCDTPSIIIFGGTDLNEHFKEGDKLEIMTKAVKKSVRCIAFNDALRQRAFSLWADCNKKMIIQPQAVEILNQDYGQNTLEKILKSNQTSVDLIFNNNAIIFLLVAGLRPVKDPLFLADTFSEWHQEDSRVYFLIVGPEININFSTQFKDTIQNSPGIIFVDGISPMELQSVMTKVFALVNTSISEGMASSILEAMSLGLPVIARRNDGNASIIEHRKTGFLFDSPKEFRDLSQELLSCCEIRSKMIENAKKYISEEHSLEKERAVYCSLVNSIK